VPLLEIKNLSKTYFEVGAPIQVLKGLDLEVKAGEMVGIVGESGAGKSTLLNIIGALEQPTEGDVLFDGLSVFQPPASAPFYRRLIRAVAARDPLMAFSSKRYFAGSEDRALSAFRNRMVGFVFQFHGLIPEFDSLENTLMPAVISGLSRAQAEEKAVAGLEELGLGQRLHHKPGELSGGEQQRVAFARALVMEPPTILADEPTGNLDNVTGEKLWDLMFEINRRRQTSFIVVTHNERLAQRLPRLYRLIGGRLESLR